MIWFLTSVLAPVNIWIYDSWVFYGDPEVQTATTTTPNCVLLFFYIQPLFTLLFIFPGSLNEPQELICKKYLI